MAKIKIENKLLVQKQQDYDKTKTEHKEALAKLYAEIQELQAIN